MNVRDIFVLGGSHIPLRIFAFDQPRHGKRIVFADRGLYIGNALRSSSDFYAYGAYGRMDTQKRDDEISWQRLRIYGWTDCLCPRLLLVRSSLRRFSNRRNVHKKGVSLFNVFMFLGAWSAVKIPMTLFEASQLGIKFTVVRFFSNLLGIIVLSLIIDKTTGADEEKELYENVSRLMDD